MSHSETAPVLRLYLSSMRMHDIKYLNLDYRTVRRMSQCAAAWLEQPHSANMTVRMAPGYQNNTILTFNLTCCFSRYSGCHLAVQIQFSLFKLHVCNQGNVQCQGIRTGYFLERSMSFWGCHHSQDISLWIVNDYQMNFYLFRMHVRDN